MSNDHRASFETQASEAMRDALAGWRYIRQSHGDLYGVGWDRVEQKLEAALASAQAASAEPVAWQVRCDGGAWGPPTTKLKVAESFVGQYGYEVRPLYTTPAPAVAPAAVTDERAELCRLANDLMTLHGKTANTYGSETLWDAAKALRRATRTPEPPISLDWTEDEQWVRSQLQRMILSSRVLVGSDGTVTGYQIKTGALHKLIGRFAVNVPLGLPEVAASPTPDEQRAQAAQARVQWPKARDLFRPDDMGQGQLRVLFDSDNDVIVAIWPEGKPSVSVEFCCPGSGGGKSPRTREALIALMVAMEQDGATDRPDRAALAGRQQP